jgi:hypothetical protein
VLIANPHRRTLFYISRAPRKPAVFMVKDGNIKGPSRHLGRQGLLPESANRVR